MAKKMKGMKKSGMGGKGKPPKGGQRSAGNMMTGFITKK